MKKSRTLFLALACAVLCAVALCACKKPDPVYRLSADELALGVGDTATVSVTVVPQTEFTCTFTSLDEGVATVSENGLVTALKAGATTIEVVVNETKTLTCAVTVTDVETVYTVRGCVKNAVDGALSGVTVKDGTATATTDADGWFALAVVKSTADTEPHVLTVQSSGFLTKTYSLDDLLTAPTVDLGEIELVRAPIIAGTLADNSFSLFTTRSSQGLHLIAQTQNLFWRNNPENLFRIMISTKDDPVLSANTYVLEQKASGHTCLQDRGDKVRSFEVGDIVITRKMEQNTLSYEYIISFDKFGLSADEVVGLAMTTTLNSLSGAMKSAADGSQIIPNLTTSFVRVGGDNVPFANEYNCPVSENPTLTYDKAALIADKTVRFALPGVANKKADDIWVKVVPTTSSFRFEMVGFGAWAADELVRIVIHTGGTDGTAWGLLATDASVLCSKTSAVVKTNIASMHDHNSVTDGTALSVTPSFEQKNGYFLYTVEVLFSEIPGYTTTGRVKAMFMEVLNNSPTFYNNDWWVGSIHNGVPCGDNAMQRNYIVIQ